ncbi:hypothetical protein PIB30_079838 [Stylosanthes scabra]|uniref:Uncharacterized protein n=1 Tax=Stylosanthes scabra TaxID=79078 RepID=A0ABU6SSI0_9FABA|nr:hypothetical protein [Stylosanthes scabra]
MDTICRYIVPDFCTSGAEVWRARVPMIIFHIVEYHKPDQVMQQFGLDQPILARPHQHDHLLGSKTIGLLPTGITFAGGTHIESASNKPALPIQTSIQLPSKEDEPEVWLLNHSLQHLLCYSSVYYHNNNSLSNQHPYQYPRYIVYLIPPPHTGVAGSSSSTATASPFPLHFPYPYPYSAYQFPPVSPPP